MTESIILLAMALANIFCCMVLLVALFSKELSKIPKAYKIASIVSCFGLSTQAFDNLSLLFSDTSLISSTIPLWYFPHLGWVIISIYLAYLLKTKRLTFEKD
jgi:hypothetical protein